jgi:rfaE bifunctional protein nucleotidyltransferase chain/domain
MSDVAEPATRLLSRADVVQRFGPGRRAGTVVFTNGVFDILHRGHVEYLYAARALGDALVIGVNTDASVRRLKGEGRPVVREDDRAFVLAGLGCVDAVTLFDEDTPARLIAALIPDVLVKGGDYSPDAVVGRDVVEANGGRLVLIPFVAGRSTTGILHRIRESET